MQVRSKGPVPVERGTVLVVTLQIDGLEIAGQEDTILWEGEIGSASFAVSVPAGAAEGTRVGKATIHAGGAMIARVMFTITVGAGTERGPVPQRECRYRKAFASYASEDRSSVLARVQGIQIGAPDIEVFLDVVSIRPGHNWQKRIWQMIPDSDIFYLFWSRHAAESKWVRMEWQCALETLGIDSIAPVPLVPPAEAPPPAELADLHFNDAWLAHIRASATAGSN